MTASNRVDSVGSRFNNPINPCTRWFRNKETPTSLKVCAVALVAIALIGIGFLPGCPIVLPPIILFFLILGIRDSLKTIMNEESASEHLEVARREPERDERVRKSHLHFDTNTLDIFLNIHFNTTRDELPKLEKPKSATGDWEKDLKPDGMNENIMKGQTDKKEVPFIAMKMINLNRTSERFVFIIYLSKDLFGIRMNGISDELIGRYEFASTLNSYKDKDGSKEGYRILTKELEETLLKAQEEQASPQP